MARHVLTKVGDVHKKTPAPRSFLTDSGAYDNSMGRVEKSWIFGIAFPVRFAFGVALFRHTLSWARQLGLTTTDTSTSHRTGPKGRTDRRAGRATRKTTSVTFYREGTDEK
jgi:hypothetical protein